MQSAGKCKTLTLPRVFKQLTISAVMLNAISSVCVLFPTAYHGVQLYKRGVGMKVGPYQLCMCRIFEVALEQLMHPLILSDTHDCTALSVWPVATTTLIMQDAGTISGPAH